MAGGRWLVAKVVAQTRGQERYEIRGRKSPSTNQSTVQPPPLALSLLSLLLLLALRSSSSSSPFSFSRLTHFIHSFSSLRRSLSLSLARALRRIRSYHSSLSPSLFESLFSLYREDPTHPIRATYFHYACDRTRRYTSLLTIIIIIIIILVLILIPLLCLEEDLVATRTLSPPSCRSAALQPCRPPPLTHRLRPRALCPLLCLSLDRHLNLSCCSPPRTA